MPLSKPDMFTGANKSPRNHWWHLSAALEALGQGHPDIAWRLLEAVRYSPLLPPTLITDVYKLVANETGFRTPLALPSDYLRHPPQGRTGLPVLRSLNDTRDLPESYPFEMVLPPITGNANDFSFMTDTFGRSEFTGSAPHLRLRAIVTIHDESELEELAHVLADPAADAVKAANVDLTVFAPAGLTRRSLSAVVAWQEGNPWQRDRSLQLSSLTAGVDALMFLPWQALADPLLVVRAQRYMSLSPTLCLMLAAPRELQDEAGAGILNDTLLQDVWRRRPDAFAALDELAFVVSAASFRSLGGFDPRFISPQAACREFAFRLYNAGAYFMPLSVRSRKDHPETPAPLADEALLNTLIPHPSRRLLDGRFETPKVSIYIPAYRAARYLAEAIESVLDQDFEDLEICVADDGSPDQTREVLEAYAYEPRVRWQTGRNGGIGHASNRAIQMTRGLYIGQLDSDDRLKPGAIRRLVAMLDENPKIGCAYGSCERVGPTGTFLHNEYSWPRFSREKMMLTSIAHHFRMFRRQTWARTEGFREDIVNGVDYDIFLKMSEVSEFRHVEEILYERRWHGDNTSYVNEAFQTTNTYRVQREALKRLDLDRHWDVHLPDPSRPRIVTYKRIGTRQRAIFWPDYNHTNPYQRMLYKEAQNSGDVMGGTIEMALRAIREVRAEDSPSVTFHLHWLNKILGDSDTLGQALDRAQDFISKLRQFKFCGGRIVWTIHNTLSHDLPFPQVELNIAREVVALADAIHVHCVDSLPEIEAYFAIPREKLHVHRHGAYVGIYPNFVDRASARAELGLSQDEEVMLFLGQIRPYKGLDNLIEAFRTIASKRPRLRLVLAGTGSVDSLLDGLDPTLRDRIHIFNRFVGNMEIQLFMNAADFTVFPYRNILTSGSLLLSLSFGVPTVVPGYGMIRAVMGGGTDGFSDSGIYYRAEEGPLALQAAIDHMLRRLESGEGPSMARAARIRAGKQTWEDIGPMLFGESA